MHVKKIIHVRKMRNAVQQTKETLQQENLMQLEVFYSYFVGLCFCIILYVEINKGKTMFLKVLAS